MLEGKLVNLRAPEENDVQLVEKWWADAEHMGEYQDTITMSKARFEKIMFKDTVFFIVEKKDGAKIGHVNGWMRGRMMEIGYAIVPGERCKGYGGEAIRLMVDHLFLSKGIVRIQAPTERRNIASQKALEKAGFSKEGTMTKSWYAKGEYKDMHLYSILREEWKEPRILTKTTS